LFFGHYKESGGASYGSGGTVERGKHAIARASHDPSSVLANDSIGVLVMIVEELTPGIIALCCELFRRGDDVGEQDGHEWSVVSGDRWFFLT
jgi:hypothetical protein